MAGRPFADVTGVLPHSGGIEGLAQAAVLSSKHTLRVLDNLIDALQDIRDEIEDGEADAFLEHLNQAYNDRLEWWVQRQKGGWLMEGMPSRSELPTGPEMLGRLIGLRKPQKK